MDDFKQQPFADAEDQWGSFKMYGFPGRIAAAYDLRSRFVHSGYPFGQWINLHISQYEV